MYSVERRISSKKVNSGFCYLGELFCQKFMRAKETVVVRVYTCVMLESVSSWNAVTRQTNIWINEVKFEKGHTIVNLFFAF